MKRKILVVIIALVSAFCIWISAACVLPYTLFGGSESFYRHGDDLFDVDINFPILKPYYAAGYPKGFPLHNDYSKYNWQIDLQGEYSSNIGWYDPICCDLQIAVEKGIVFIYLPTTPEFDPQLHQEIFHWFVLNPKDKIELGLKTEAEFNSYLDQLNLEKPKWHDPDDLHYEFIQTGCLDWFPDCRKIPPLLRFPPRVFDN
jgi:hypothetical protein